MDAKLDSVASLGVPEYPEGSEPIYMSFVVHHRDRQRLAEALRSRGVDTTTGYMNDMAHHDLFGSFAPSVPMHKRQMLSCFTYLCIRTYL